MWIAIIGAPGTGKNFVAEYLQRQSFELIKRPTIDVSSAVKGGDFRSHIRISMDKLRDQLKAGSMRDRSNVITIGTYWDAHLIYSEILRNYEIVSKDEKEILDEIFSAYRDPGILAVPHAIVYTTADKMAAMNRIKLRGMEFNPDLFIEQSRRFKEFAERIRVPVVEVDAVASPEVVYQSLDFGINSLKASALHNGSVWGKDFFYE